MPTTIHQSIRFSSTNKIYFYSYTIQYIFLYIFLILFFVFFLSFVYDFLFLSKKLHFFSSPSWPKDIYWTLGKKEKNVQKKNRKKILPRISNLTHTLSIKYERILPFLITAILLGHKMIFLIIFTTDMRW